MSFNGRMFGRRLKAAMALAGMEVKQVAQVSGLTYEIVRKMAAGERKAQPSWPELEAVARAVNQDPDWLLRLDFSLEEAPPPPTAEERKFTEEELGAAEAVLAARLELLVDQFDGLLQRLEQASSLALPDPDVPPTDEADPPTGEVADGS